MRHFIIGGDGFVGTSLRHRLGKRGLQTVSTTRRFGDNDNLDRSYLDLRNPELPRPAVPFTHVYLVAAMTKFADCEGNPLSWVVNVDAPIAIARQVRRTAFVTFISSDAVEWAGSTAYGRQKAAVESYIQSIDGAIVRPCKIPPERVDEFCDLVVDTALARKVGVTRWQ